MRKHPIIRVADDGRDNLSLWDRCRLIVEQGIKKYGDAGSLPVSGTGRARKKVDQGKKGGKVKPPTSNKNRYEQTKDDADGPIDACQPNGKRRPRTR